MSEVKPYTGNDKYIYASYADADRDAVMSILSALCSRGFRVWYDQSGGRGDSQKLEGCSVYLAFISNAALKTPMFVFGINSAVKKGKTPFVIYLDNTAVTPGLQIILGSVQGMYRTRHSSEELFIKELCSSRLLLTCADGAAAEERGEKNLDSSEFAYIKGEEAMKASNYSDAAMWFRKAADMGNAKAQRRLGFCYEYGKGVNEDPEKAVFWYRKAAEQGDGDALRSLSGCYFYGKGVPQSDAEGMRLLTEAAEVGYVYAQYELADRYFWGEKTGQDYTKAAQWYRKAAENGDNMAMAMLGDCYYNGCGVKRDYTEAVSWYKRSDDDSAKLAYAKCCIEGLGTPKAPAEGAKILEALAKDGNEQAMFELGYCYEMGLGVPKDAEYSNKWYFEAKWKGFDVDSARQDKLNKK